MTDWAGRRKFMYASGLLIAITAMLVYSFRDRLFPAPTCFDAKQNGYETGVDCGGVCALRCVSEVIPLSVSFARAVPTSPNTYDLVGLVSNNNIDSAPHRVLYAFAAYNANGALIASTTGSTIVPVDGDFPIIAQKVHLAQAPQEVSLTLQSNVPYFKVAEKPTVPTIRVPDIRYEAGAIPRVYATIINTKRLVLKDLPVRVVLYDVDGNAFAAGQTIIPKLEKEGSQTIVLTWDRAFSLSPTKIRVYPILDPFLGQ